MPLLVDICDYMNSVVKDFSSVIPNGYQDLNFACQSPTSSFVARTMKKM